MKWISLLRHRSIQAMIAILLLTLCLIYFLWNWKQYIVVFYFLTYLLEIGAVIHLLKQSLDSRYQISWLVVMILFPIIGCLFYILFGSHHLSKKNKNKLGTLYQQLETYNNSSILNKLQKESYSAYQQAKYIHKYAYASLYDNAESMYLENGQVYFKKLLKALESANKFIFMEFYIIKSGYMWNSILNRLENKRQKGIEIKIIIDDFGSSLELKQIQKDLESRDISYCIFNPYASLFSTKMNHRDHRKLVIVDGKIAFTGGINIGDEYINVSSPYHIWKDSGILIKGECVWNFTLLFLTLWNYCKNDIKDYKYYQADNEKYETNSYIIPFGISPYSNQSVIQKIYINLIQNAVKSIQVTTPYLILDHLITTLLCNAAEKGVRIEIFTPGVADKKIVNEVTKMNYEILLKNGIHIYEYKPGFLHQKVILVDEYAMVGTINLDYRSFFLQWEDAVWIYRGNTLLQIKKDIENIKKASEEIKIRIKISKIQKLRQNILKILFPIL